MSTITLTGNTLCGSLGIDSFTNIGTALSKAKQTTSNLANELNSLKNKIDVACTVANVDTSKHLAINAKKQRGNKEEFSVIGL